MFSRSEIESAKAGSRSKPNVKVDFLRNVLTNNNSQEICHIIEIVFILALANIGSRDILRQTKDWLL